MVVLTLNEEPNIRRCLALLAWGGPGRGRGLGFGGRHGVGGAFAGREVVEQPWLGYSAQRERTLRLPLIRHYWGYFVDADQLVSPQLAAEISAQLADPDCDEFAHWLRLVFMGTWIRHCGWYPGSWVVRLVERRASCTKDDGSAVGDRASVDGRIRRLGNDMVDEDRKGLAAWLHNHVRYAELRCERRGSVGILPERMRTLRSRSNTRPLARSILKGWSSPDPGQARRALTSPGSDSSTAWPGSASGFYHAWYEMSVASLRAEARTSGG